MSHSFRLDRFLCQLGRKPFIKSGPENMQNRPYLRPLNCHRRLQSKLSPAFYRAGAHPD